MAVKIWSRSRFIKKWKLVELHIPDFVGVAFSNRLMLKMPAVLPGNICFNLWVNGNLITAMLFCIYVCMYFLTHLQSIFYFYTPWKQWISGGTAMEHLLEMGQYLPINNELQWFLICSKSQWNRNRYVTVTLNPHFWIMNLCKYIFLIFGLMKINNSIVQYKSNKKWKMEPVSHNVFLYTC